ncbi:unnamed protein product [Rhodiola kirilowii]
MEYDKKCRVSLSQNMLLPPMPPSPKVEKRNSKSKPRRRDELLIIEDDDFTEIRFSRFRSASCKNESSRPLQLNGGVELRRGSVYQTSREVKSKKNLGSDDVRSKIEISRSSDKYISVRNLDSPCLSSHASPLNRYLVNYNGEPSSSNDFARNQSIMSSVVKLSKQGDPFGNSNCKFERVARPQLDGKCSLEKDICCRSLHKPVFAKVAIQQSPRESIGDSPRASPKSRFSPIKKIMDPFMKSKSQKSPLGLNDDRITETINASNGITQESLMPDISDKARSLDVDSQFAEIDCCHLAAACSPTHLHGCLKQKQINGVPIFEFSLKSPEVLILAMTWKTKSAESWMYTFHTSFNRKHSNASARGSKVCDNTDTCIVGQLQVSSYLPSKHEDNVIGKSLTTEFVLYDIAHANRGFSAQESSLSLPDAITLSKCSVGCSVEDKLNSDNLAEHEKLTATSKHASDLSLFDSTSYPWALAYLHPNLEVAAIVIQIPFENRESLKHGKTEKIEETRYNEVKRGNHIRATPGYPKISVVASTGNHSLPEAECHGPSPLLSRWRSGGGCDCGGWDMMCPLIVFNNGIDTGERSHLPLVEKTSQMELFVEGAKEDTPAFSMTAVEEGHYSVNFHVRLSALQAFSISIAMLHSWETSRNIPRMLQCNTLETFLKDEVKLFMESVTDMSKKKTATSEKDKIPSNKDKASFTFNPPLSPICRS